jgi:hypothetical protein
MDYSGIAVTYAGPSGNQLKVIKINYNVFNFVYDATIRLKVETKQKNPANAVPN